MRFRTEWTNPGSAVGTPESNSDFKTLEMAITRRFKGRWMLMASFGKTWSKEFVQETTRTGVQDYLYHDPRFRWEPNQRLFGRTDSNNWNAKLVGRYTIPSLGLAASSTLRMLSGYNWARTVTVALPVAGSVTIPTTPTSANRAPSVNILDLRLHK